MVNEEQIMNVLKEVYDPEIPVNIVDMGLIYEIKINNGNIHIQMTLTTMGCPAGADIEANIKKLVSTLKGVKNVEVEITFDPPWTPARMTEDAKAQLGLV